MWEVNGNPSFIHGDEGALRGHIKCPRSHKLITGEVRTVWIQSCCFNLQEPLWGSEKAGPTINHSQRDRLWKCNRRSTNHSLWGACGWGASCCRLGIWKDLLEDEWSSEGRTGLRLAGAGSRANSLSQGQSAGHVIRVGSMWTRRK